MNIERNCQTCKYYKDGYCENLELKPCYPQKGCDDFSQDLVKVSQEISQELCEDCVSRERIKQIISNITAEFDTETIHIDRLLDEIDNLPPVRPTRKTGKWVENAPEYQRIDPPYICSECGNMHLRKTNYCDQCGAKMEEILTGSAKYEAKVITRGNCMKCGKELTEGLFFCNECEAESEDKE